MKNYLKTGILLFGISLLLWNCEKNTIIQPLRTNQDGIFKIDAETVSFKEAKDYFEVKKKEATLKKTTSDFIVTPDWNTLDNDSVHYTDALVTKTNVNINRAGNFTSELLFIKVKGKMKNVIYTIYKDTIGAEGEVVFARVFFNEIDGTFIDGYIIENGKFTKRYQKEPINTNKTNVIEKSQKTMNAPIVFCDYCWTIQGGTANLGTVYNISPQIITFSPRGYTFTSYYGGNSSSHGGGQSSLNVHGGHGHGSLGIAMNTLLADPLPNLVTDSPDKPIDNLSKYLKCFNQNEGATVTIYVDQPVANSNSLFSFKDKVGHAFIGIKQGSNTAVYGFYPAGSAYPGNPSSPPKMGDDSQHAYDVSIPVNISAGTLRNIITTSKNYQANYNLNTNNCTDFAIRISQSLGLNFPDCYASWVVGAGSNPASLGQYMRTLPNANTNGGVSPSNVKGCK